jgi:adenosylcobinamide-phosphate synthase
MLPYGALWVIPAAFLLDLLAGDPPRLPHPIRWMGLSIAATEPVFRRLCQNELGAGGLFVLFHIALTWAAVSAAVMFAVRIDPLAGLILEIILVYYSLSVRSLKDAALAVATSRKAEGVGPAREKVAEIVGRDTRQLAPDGIARATVETVAENLVDGVLSPLFFAALGGAPLALTFKMVSTLDSMVGYKNDRYLRFGRPAARLDDLANYIPARLSAPIIALAAQLLYRRGVRAWTTARREGRRHRSPNAGIPEAAFAGALSVKLGGPGVYHGVRVDKPHIGVDMDPVRPEDIPAACNLMLLSAVLGALVAWGISTVRLFYLN